MSSLSASSPRVFLRLSLNNQLFVALADSGADISVISTSALGRLGGVPVNSSFTVSFRGVGRTASLSGTLGTVRLSLDVGGFQAPSAMFHVVKDDDIGYDVILGADLMYKYYLAPTPAHQKLIYAPRQSAKLYRNHC